MLADTTESYRIRPPFPKMQSFGITAIILSYFNYKKAVKCLLFCLSHKVKDYYYAHSIILEGYLIPFESEQKVYCLYPIKLPFFGKTEITEYSYAQ